MDRITNRHLKAHHRGRATCKAAFEPGDALDADGIAFGLAVILKDTAIALIVNVALHRSRVTLIGGRLCGYCKRRPVDGLRAHMCETCRTLKSDERIMQPRHNPPTRLAVLRKALAAHEIVLD